MRICLPRLLSVCLLAAVALGCHPATTAEPVDAALDTSLTFFYSQPAKAWDSGALPLGNGRIGCMVFGGVARERVQFNDSSLWTGDENPSGDYGSMGAYQNFGDLFLTVDGGAAPDADYRRELNLAGGTSRVTFRKDGALHTRETFASHPDDVIVLRWTADRPGAVSGAIELEGAHKETTTASEAELKFAGKLSNGLAYEAVTRVITRGGKVAAENGTLRLEGCDEAVLLLAASTDYAMDPAKNFRGKPPAERNRAVLERASKRSFAELRTRHLKDFQGLFGRVSLDLGRTAAEIRALPMNERLQAYAKGGSDPEMEALLFQYGRYLLMSCSRRPGLPANLQGLWNDSNNPAWHSDYHANINVQMNYWGAEVGNLGECHLPFFDLIQSQLDAWRRATQADKEYQAASGPVHGWTLRTSHNIFGGMGWQWDKTANAWYCQHLWEHYAFSGDKEYLRNVAYPILKEVCEFWESQLKSLPDGRLVVPKGWSPEHGPHEDGVSYSQQIVWDLFNNYAQASEELGVDADYRARITGFRDKLVGPKVGSWGQLQEWMTDRDDPKDGHRHTSHLFGVYPGHQISMAQTPEFAKAAAVSLEARGTRGDSRRSWTWPWRCALWARLGEPEKAYAMIRGLFTYNMLPNLFATHPPFQMDGNFGYVGGVGEMLLQSHAGEIALLPALPRAWSDGKATGLRARGNCTVDIEWKAGQVTRYHITSPTTRKVKVHVNGETKQVKTSAN